MVNVAIIGVGSISGIYLKNMKEMFREVRVLGVCDLIRERAERAQDEYGIPKIYETMYDAFADDEVSVILNLTRPYEHFEVSRLALEAGKHVYHEKPLGIDTDEGSALSALAESKGLLLGGAPDTYLGAGIQTCRKIIDDGWIGEPIGAAAFMVCHGHETWHPDPEFYYKRGGGPMMDMGPYYITALINMLGGIKGVMGATKRNFDQRIITSQPHCGEIIDVDVDTHQVGIMHFDNGAIGTIFTTFDVHYGGQARLEVYGTKGTLFCPDPNRFGGPVRLLRPEDRAATLVDPGLTATHGDYAGSREMPLMFDYADNSRGLGLADMCKAIETGRPFRSSYQQTRHVLEVITAFEKSSKAASYLPIMSGYTRGEAMKNNPITGVLD